MAGSGRPLPPARPQPSDWAATTIGAATNHGSVRRRPSSWKPSARVARRLIQQGPHWCLCPVPPGPESSSPSPTGRPLQETPPLATGRRLIRRHVLAAPLMPVVDPTSQPTSSSSSLWIRRALSPCGDLLRGTDLIPRAPPAGVHRSTDLLHVPLLQFT
ncbi:hypothetical protein VPH35_050587 [Triticum aestivum]